MRDWESFLRELVDGPVWGFVALDYYYHLKKRGETINPSEFIDKLIDKTDLSRADVTQLHHSILAISIQLLGNDIDDVIGKSVRLMKRLELTREIGRAILNHYDSYGLGVLAAQRLGMNIENEEVTTLGDLQESYPKVRVFVSYTHDSPAHKRSVLVLAQRLRSEGLDCWIDQMETYPAEGWPLWMERQIELADFVLVVCSKVYLRRYQLKEQQGEGLGGAWEGAVIRQELYKNATKNRKFIPVLLENGAPSDIPSPLSGHTYYEIMADYDSLYRVLTSQPKVVPSPIGRKRAMPPDP